MLLARRDFDRLAAQAQRQTEDEYWTASALQAEADAKAKNQKPIAFSEVERELNARRKSRPGSHRRGKGSR